MDSKRLTEIEERCEKATHSTMQMGTKLVRGYWWAMEPATFAVHALRDLPDLVAAYKLLRADAAELARNAQRLYQILQPERDETRALNDAMNGGQSARFDLSEQHMFANLKASLSRPSVVNLLKEKDGNNE